MFSWLSFCSPQDLSYPIYTRADITTFVSNVRTCCPGFPPLLCPEVLKDMVTRGESVAHAVGCSTTRIQLHRLDCDVDEYVASFTILEENTIYLISVTVSTMGSLRDDQVLMEELYQTHLAHLSESSASDVNTLRLVYTTGTYEPSLSAAVLCALISLIHLTGLSVEWALSAQFDAYEVVAWFQSTMAEGFCGPLSYPPVTVDFRSG